MSTAVSVRIEMEDENVLKAVKRSSNKALRSAGAYVRKTAQNAVSKSPKSSSPGTPPHTRRGLLRRSILFGVEKERMTVVIGSAESFIGISMTAHEFGGMYRRRKYPKRPLMEPSLEKASPHIPKMWEDAVKQ